MLLSQPPATEQSAALVAAMEPGPRAVVTFGTLHGADWQAVAITPNIEGGTDFVAVRKASCQSPPVGRPSGPWFIHCVARWSWNEPQA